MRASMILTLIALGLLAVTPVSAGPQIVVEAKAFDAGEVEQGGVIEHAFLIRNPGDRTLEITNVRPSCGCTVAGDFDREIPAGGEGVIPVELDTSEFRGRISKTITVTSNAENGSRTILQMKAMVTLPLEVLPNPSLYVRARQGEAAEARVLLRPRREGLKVTGAVSSDPRVRVSVEPAEAETPPEGLGPLARRLNPVAGDHWLRVALDEGLSPGSVSAIVVVKTSDPTYPSVEVRVQAEVSAATGG